MKFSNKIQIKLLIIVSEDMQPHFPKKLYKLS
jgi:hypothetical protein